MAAGDENSVAANDVENGEQEEIPKQTDTFTVEGKDESSNHLYLKIDKDMTFAALTAYHRSAE